MRPSATSSISSTRCAISVARRTIARATVAVRGLHKFMSVEELRDDDPTSDVEMPGVPRGLPKALSEDEVLRLLAAVDGADALSLRDRAMLEVLYGAGLRISELCGLSLSDIDMRDCLMRVFGKGSKERIVPDRAHVRCGIDRLLRCAADGHSSNPNGGSRAATATRCSSTRAAAG